MLGSYSAVDKKRKVKGDRGRPEENVEKFCREVGAYTRSHQSAT
jgi:hypothetical protein